MSVVLSEHLPLLASAPNGIQKLRDLILRLAVEGRLTDTDTASWGALTLADVGEWGSGGTPLKAHADYYGGDIPWLVIGDLNDGVVGSAETFITEKGLANSSAKLVPPGTLLIAMYGSIGKLGITGIECATNQAIAHCKVNNEIADCGYLFYFVRAIRGQLLSSGQGLAQQNISQKILKATPLRLPPLPEQHRIVSKVDELMALCDRLEAEQTDAETAHAKLVETLLGTLTKSTGAADLAANWQRLAEHFDTHFTTESSLDALKQTILQLAVMGKLVPQDPNDEPASELLKRIAKERARMEAEGKIKKSKPVPPVGDDEQHFALPVGWAWIRLGQVGDWGAGATPLRSNPRYYGGAIPWFKSGELTADFISDAEEHVTELALKECSLRQNQTGDVLIAMYGATIGKTAVLAKPATTNQAVCACTPNIGVFNRYLLTLLKALKPNFIGQGAGGAQPNISREKIIATVAALPPEAEQHRIVAKVDELMALCDSLKAELAESRTRQERLATTLIETALKAV